MTSTDYGLMKIEIYLIRKYGVDAADRIIAPLTWYCRTGRASAQVCKKIFAAKPYMIARRLYNNGDEGSVEDAVQRVLDYVWTL